MNHEEFAQQVLAHVGKSPLSLPKIEVDETRRNNAGRCMTALICHRLAQGGTVPSHVRHTTFSWGEGIVAIRNARVTDGHWSTYQLAVGRQLHEVAQHQPVTYLLTYWAMDEGLLHAWAVPEDVAFRAFEELPPQKTPDCKTVEVSPEDHQLVNAPSSPSFAPYYAKMELSEPELAKVAEAIKTDDSIKKVRQAEEDKRPENKEITDPLASSDDGEEEWNDEVTPAYSEQTVSFLLELPEHVEDGEWHEQNKRRYQLVLRDPSQFAADELASRYIQKLSPVVAGGKRHLSILKKNDFGKGGYHDHYWFAFYDPAAGSKTKSVQLFVHFLGSKRVWGYGLSMGNYCREYMERLLTAISQNPVSVANYLRTAPDGTIIRLFAGETEHELSPIEFADRLAKDSAGKFSLDDAVTSIIIIREYPLDTLPDHAESFVDETGVYFTWAWPFFDAAMSGKWRLSELSPANVEKLFEDEDADVDESAPQTIEELALLTSLQAEFLTELEEALLAKQQVVLVGPPGTSKTYIARQFARYFVRQRHGSPQGSFDTLYMHANWGYEDFFEGIKPTSNAGSLTFEPRDGFFLKWVKTLSDYDPHARHVIILDEINRCDTAAVLGELLQLLEYRGTTVSLLSGRSFVFPTSVFIIGTMNSADRSIGRMDLALRRRFLWLDLFPRPDALQKWLDRRGNNPLGFEANSLARCNELLGERGIPPEQQIGHALFMLQRIDSDDQASPQLDVPLSERKLRQIVRFSVVPYVRELLTLQLGKADDQLLQQISGELLKCVEGPSGSTNLGPTA